MSSAIREIGLAERGALGELLDTLRPGWSDALHPGASGPLAFVADPRSFALGAYIDGQPVGLLWGVHIRQPDGGSMTYVHELEVLAPNRRQGLGGALIEAAYGAARRAGSQKLWMVGDGDEVVGEIGGRLGASVDDQARVYSWDLP